jgi:outer membrane receptor protein involved in Fe transport
MDVRKYQSMTATAAFALLLVAGAAPAKAQPAGQFSFDLPAESLSQALRDVAARTGRDVIVPSDLVGDTQAQPLSGTFTAEEAVARLLAGTGLRSRLVDGTLVVERGPFAEGAGRPPVRSEADEIVVTGTNVRGAPPSSPVITLTRRDIDAAAAASVEELLRKLPQNLSSGVAQENVGVSGTGADITDQGAGIDLRGLGQRATLVLVNGRRVAPSGTGSFVDVSMIPVSALERVEVLTDGASAIYGSDAVGGVVNLILRKDFTGLEASAQGGTATRGGGDQFLGSATAGTRWGSGHAMLSYEYRSEGEIKAGDRAFTINLPSDWSLFPREQRHNVFGVVRQGLGPNASLEVSGLYSQRHTRRSFFEGGSAIPVEGDAHARLLGGTAAFSLDLGLWRAEASATAFEDRTREASVQGGVGLFNRFNTRNRMVELALRADGTLIDLPGGPAKLAIGALSRSEHFASLFETDLNEPNPQSGSRTVRAIYGELNIPLIGAPNRIAGFDRLVASIAGRAEHYQGIGSTFNPKLGLLWSPAKGLTLRSTYSTSFRAPLLNETLGLYSAYLFPASFLFIDPATAPAGVGLALVGSNPAVKPERSRSFSAGIDIAPPKVPGLQLRATYYAIRFSNRITFPTDQIVVVGNPALDPIVTRDPSAALVGGLLEGAGQVLDVSGPGFTNGGATADDVDLIVDIRSSNTAETRTSGLDLGINYDFAIGRNKFRAELNANHIFRFDDRLTKASPVIHTLNTPFHPVDWRARGGLSWSLGPLAAWLYGNFTNAYRDTRSSPSMEVRSSTTFDAGASLSAPATAPQLLRGGRVALVVQNLFDADPPRLRPDPGFTKGTGYDPVNSTGRGRTVSVQLRKSW